MLVINVNNNAFFSIDDENFDKDEQIKELKEPTATTTITTTNDA